MIRTRCIAGLVTLALTGTASAAAGQTPASREDSIRALRAAHSRQTAFERIRRNNLPWAWGGGRSGPCDEYIGRFCLTYGDDDSPDWVPPPEKEQVTKARRRLVDELAEAARVIPGDRWVTGHRVRYLVEAGLFDQARAAAAECRAEGWWCDALQGYAAHYAGAAVEADRAFSRMLPAMPEEKRREWTDLRDILDPRSAARYRQLDEAGKAAFEHRFWTLATPQMLGGANEVRSEHFSRNLIVELQDRRTESPEDLRWGDDLREILIRFGPPLGWQRIRPSAYSLHTGDVSIVTHFPEAGVDLVPPPELLSDLFDPTAGDWNDEQRMARASYPLPRAGEHVRWITEFDHQTAVLRDRDSALIVAAWQLPADSLPAGSTVDVTLSALYDPAAAPLAVWRGGAGARSVLSLAVPPRPVLVSLGAHAPAHNRAARARFGLAPEPLVPGVLAASDILLVELQGDSIPDSRAEAIAAARPSARVRAGEKLGIYWEVYAPGMGRPELLDVSLRLVGDDVSWLRRLGERVGIVGRIEPIRLAWGDGTDGGETLSRSLAITIPEGADPRRYILELSLTAPDRDPVVLTKAIRVVR